MFPLIKHSIKQAFALAFTGITLISSAWAIDLPKDVPGSKDPAVLQRFAGSTLIGYKSDPWDTARFPVSGVIENNGFKNLVAVEGVRTRAVYLSPHGKTPVEIFRNYEQALKAAGFKKKYACDVDCSDAYSALLELKVKEGLSWANGDIPNGRGGAYATQSAMTYLDGRLLCGTLPRGGGAEAWVMVYVSRAKNDATGFSQAFVQVVEPKTMQTGQVTVLNASDIQAGLRSEGKVAFYGLYFDTGKAEIKPSSQPQLVEMGKVLNAQPTLQVFVVGHTDGQGSLDANLQLSQQRAQAVVEALVKSQGIEARRLTAKGVASLAPVSTNATEEGRARNRRVELVAR